MEFNTKLIHGNHGPDKSTGSTTTPIYQSNSFHHSTAEELERVFNGSEYGYIYSRINNPTVDAFEKRIALLEKGAGAVACSSGMSAIALAVLNLLGQGDELVASSGLFGGTYSLLTSLADYGIKARFSTESTTASLEQLINEKTRLIFVEAIGNPKMDVPNIADIAELAHAHQIPLLVDNTVTTPYLLRPIEHGADIVIHSTSKLINGGGNSIGGIIIDKGRLPWSAEKFPILSEMRKQFSFFAYLAKLRKGLHRDIGACMAPMNAYLTGLGLETLGVRMDKACSNAFELASFLQNHPGVRWVNYPGLQDNPYHELAVRQFGDKYGVILTFGVGSKANAFKVINNLKLAYNLANIGDVRTLVIHPASTIYSSNTPEERKLLGVTGDLVRVSAGIEDIRDLLDDFEKALKSIKN